MKTLVLLLALIFLTSTAAGTWARNGEPQFKLETKSSGFDVLVSYPDGEPTNCTVKVEVTFSATSPKAGTQKFEYTRTVHSTGNGWAWFGGEPKLDTFLHDAKILGTSCA